tara:strand:- start:1741 stop:2565 length:825 start_codon:yes stop_codon:yes gene_type:complete
MDNEKQLLISRIIANKVPAYDYDVELVYYDTLRDAIFGGCLTNQELLDKLGAPIDFGSEIKKTNQTLIKKRQDLYEWRSKPASIGYREEIKTLKETVSFLLNEQYKFFIHSAEQIATEAKNKKICEKYSLEEVPDRLDETGIRSIAKSYEWTALSNAGFVFDVLSVDAIELVNWGRRYDNIRQHPDSPEEEVMEDDDMLDGWTSYVANKKDDVGNNDSGGAETFTVAHSPEDVKRIQDRNSPEARFMMKLREEKMKQGEVSDKDFADKQGLIKF